MSFKGESCAFFSAPEYLCCCAPSLSAKSIPNSKFGVPEIAFPKFGGLSPKSLPFTCALIYVLMPPPTWSRGHGPDPDPLAAVRQWSVRLDRLHPGATPRAQATAVRVPAVPDAQLSLHVARPAPSTTPVSGCTHEALLQPWAPAAASRGDQPGVTRRRLASECLALSPRGRAKRRREWRP